MNNQLNNEKGQLFKGKTTKSSIAFRRNKPNSPIVQTDVMSFTTMNYTIFTSLTKVKNKPNSNPIKAKTNPIQTQFQIDTLNHCQDESQILIKFIDSCYTKTPSKNDGNEVDIYMLLCHYIKHLIWSFNLRVGSQPKFRFGIENHAETSSN